MRGGSERGCEGLGDIDLGRGFDTNARLALRRLSAKGYVGKRGVGGLRWRSGCGVEGYLRVGRSLDGRAFVWRRFPWRLRVGRRRAGRLCVGRLLNARRLGHGAGGARRDGGRVRRCHEAIRAAM